MKAKATRDNLLTVGLNMLSVTGLSGVTLGRLATSAGLSKSGLFAHFRSKEQLQLELLDQMTRVANVQVMEPAMRSPEGLPRIKAFVSHWFGWSHKAGLSGGCPIAAALFELDDLQGELRQRTAAMEAELRAMLEGQVEAAVACGHLSAETDPRQFVWELFGIYLSHHVSSRFLRDPEADARAERAFSSLLNRAGDRTSSVQLH